jgi:hypothetical protein
VQANPTWTSIFACILSSHRCRRPPC